MGSNLVAVTAKYKLRVFQRLSKYLNTRKVKVLANAFSNTKFYYASMIWMFVGKRWYQKFKRYITEHCILCTRNHMKICSLWLVISLLHQNHLHFLATEIFKSVNNFNLQFMWNYFSFKPILYELRKENVCFSSGIDLARD